jgi:hypothetical protein
VRACNHQCPKENCQIEAPHSMGGRILASMTGDRTVLLSYGAALPPRFLQTGVRFYTTSALQQQLCAVRSLIGLPGCGLSKNSHKKTPRSQQLNLDATPRSSASASRSSATDFTSASGEHDSAVGFPAKSRGSRCYS